MQGLMMDYPLTLTPLLERAYRLFPNKEIVTKAGPSLKRLTYAEMNQRANRLANWLKAAGVQKGDRVGILANDGVEHLDVFFACGKLGASHTGLNWRLHWRELLGIFQNVTPKVIFIGDPFRENIIQLAQADTSVTRWAHLDGMTAVSMK